MNNWPNPFIEQRADPFILRHLNHYYFIASVPEYDRLEIRRAATLEGLRDAEPVVVWRAPQSGPMSQLIWAPELHEIDGKWYIYFAATHTHDLDALGMFQHRMFVIECADNDPLTGRWQEKARWSPLSIPSPSMPPPLSIRANAGTCGRKNRRISRATQTCISLKWPTRGR